MAVILLLLKAFNTGFAGTRASTAGVAPNLPGNALFVFYNTRSSNKATLQKFYVTACINNFKTKSVKARAKISSYVS